LIHVLTVSENESWFNIDWDNIYNLLKLWEARNVDGGNILANYLHYIPVRFYGFSPTLIKHFPPIELLYILLIKHEEIQRISSQILITLEIYDQFEAQWSETERQAAWRRLHQVEQNPDQYPDIMRHLPILAKWACRMTGNPILDYPPPQWSDNRILIPQPYYFRWDDASLARMLWQRAKPIIDLLEPFMEWYREDPDNCLIDLFVFLAEGELHFLEAYS
jgi:hypothetical protein